MVTNNCVNEPTAASGTVLQGQGVGTASTFSIATYPSTATGTGTILRADGTNWSATTSTYPNTNAINTLLYASSANTMAALATANNGVLITSGAGAPSISSTLPSAVQGNITSVGNLGNQTNTTRAVFSAILSSTDSNVTGDGTTYTLGSGNVLTVTQQGSAMSTGGTFTAPVTGYYLFVANISCTGSATATDGLMQIVVNSGAYNVARSLPKDLSASSYNASLIVQMSATQTTTFTLTVSGVTKSLSVTGGAGNPTSVCGFLLC
jgi:hypothetical protein